MIPILIILFALLVFVGGVRHGYPVSGRRIVTYQDQPGRFGFETLVGIIGFGAIAALAATDDRLIKSIALTVLVGTLVARLGAFLVLALVRGGVGSADRLDNPRGYWTRVTLLALAILLICAMLGLALSD
jgi:hypothetical protein